jgi:DNA-binding response OmpR family regulator
MQRKKILCVDDSNTILLMEKLILGKWDYQLLVAHDGEEALEVAARERPDLILLDVVMPRLNGFETCRRMRALEATRAVPVIMVTTRGELENVEQAYGTGCTDFVTKPIDTLELLTKVRICLGE